MLICYNVLLSHSFRIDEPEKSYRIGRIVSGIGWPNYVSASINYSPANTNKYNGCYHKNPYADLFVRVLALERFSLLIIAKLK